MSLEDVYKRIPLEERVCEGCGKTIQRNAFILDGKLYHGGCLKKTRANPTHRCLECFSLLTRKGMSRVDWGESGRYQLACGNCGSVNLRPVKRWWTKRPHQQPLFFKTASIESQISLSRHLRRGGVYINLSTLIPRRSNAFVTASSRRD